MLMRLSALQIPRLTHTAMGGNKMAMSPRKMSLPHMIIRLMSDLEKWVRGRCCVTPFEWEWRECGSLLILLWRAQRHHESAAALSIR